MEKIVILSNGNTATFDFKNLDGLFIDRSEFDELNDWKLTLPPGKIGLAQRTGTIHPGKDVFGRVVSELYQFCVPVSGRGVTIYQEHVDELHKYVENNAIGNLRKITEQFPYNAIHLRVQVPFDYMMDELTRSTND